MEPLKPIIPADKALRKKVLILLVLGMLIGFFLIQGISAYVEECKSLADTDIEAAVVKIRNLLTAVTIANALFSTGLALYFILLSRKIFKADCYPPPGMRVIQDTELRTGKAARIIGVILIFMAMIILSGNLMMWYIHVIIDKVISISL